LIVPNLPPRQIYAGEPCDAIYWRYSLRCHVGREANKAYYWAKLADIYAAILPLIGGWEDQRLNSDQALQRMVGKPEPNGSFRATLRNAPVGGLQKLTPQNLEKVGSKYLADNDHLRARFDNNGLDHARFYEPKGRERVYFFLHEIFALKKRLKHDRSVMYQSLPHDFWLRVGGYEHQYATSRADPINQAIDIYVWQGAASSDDADALAVRIGALTSARHIWKSETGHKSELYTDTDGNYRLKYSAYDQIEDAVDGHNRYGSRWVDLLGER
jgi:hypothetical protein